MAEDYSPVVQGDTGAPFIVHFLHKDGSTVDLTGATITMKMVNQDSPSTTKTCLGTWTIDDASGGIAHYQYQAADVNTAGIWILYITITIGGAPLHADSKLLEILAAP